MTILLEREKVISLILGIPKIDKTNYRKIKYLVEVPKDNGTIIYNTLTAELLFLNYEETVAFNNPNNIEDITVKSLIEKWFLVSIDCDESKLCKQLFSMLPLFNPIVPNAKKSGYTIIPTTDCNARCFYCYELGCNRRSMTDKTAHDVADYIYRTHNESRPVKITWFGGEPTYNSKAIDIICSDLRSKGIEYRSQMVSNGYLIDDILVQKAKNDWNIYKIQITIDGTEEVYNKTKAFIYKDSISPFKRY